MLSVQEAARDVLVCFLRANLILPTYSNPINLLVPIMNSQKLYGLLRSPEESKPNPQSRTPL